MNAVTFLTGLMLAIAVVLFMAGYKSTKRKKPEYLFAGSLTSAAIVIEAANRLIMYLS